jgi:RNA polymerase sigma factor (sigma-70 family)
MADSGIQQYLDNICRYPLLTADQEILLGRQIQEWVTTEKPSRGVERVGRKALNQMMLCNLRLVVAVAKKYTKRAKKSDLMDLVQEGTVGLISACKKFDPERGYKFSTYSHWWIRQAISRYICQGDRTIRLPGHANDVLTKVAYWGAEFARDHGRQPTIEECAKFVSINPETLKKYLMHSTDAGSLDKPAGGVGAEGKNLAEVIADETQEDPMEALAITFGIEYLDDMLAELNPQEEEIVKLHFGIGTGEPMTWNKLGQHFGGSRERVRQVALKALLKLKVRSTGAYLKSS